MPGRVPPVRRDRPTRHESFLAAGGYRWAKIAAAVIVVAVVLYVVDRPQPVPSGSSAYGYASGTISAALVVWLSLIGVRKRWITRGRWSLKGWTSAHVYLGLALLVIATLHSGFRFGVDVHTLAWLLLVIVVVSGMVGTVLYATLPRALSDNRGETTERQMIDMLAGLDRQIEAAALPLDAREGQLAAATIAESPFAAGAWRRLTGCFAGGAARRARGALTEPPIAALLDRRAAAVARIERHLHLKALLDGWLYVHVPATFALYAALTAHIVAVLLYW